MNIVNNTYTGVIKSTKTNSEKENYKKLYIL